MVELQGETSEGCYNVGMAKFSAGDFRGAVRSFEASSALNKKNVKVLLKLAESKYNIQDYRGASEAGSMAIAADQKNASGYYIRGLARINYGDEKGGVEDLRMSASFGNAEASRALANIGK